MKNDIRDVEFLSRIQSTIINGGDVNPQFSPFLKTNTFENYLSMWEGGTSSKPPLCQKVDCDDTWQLGLQSSHVLTTKVGCNLLT